ncbi:hypothetical protein DERF_007891 [Dermatophagoides farinae]|uniref:Uncharacterized protein n=1 Tax=Dermatophagoides farinae TaxID=6954 RepID=A0A922I293_DERFA|nr:uncharacterized protein LOC124497179 [Dermatophagoides farinae]KAH7646656.1 hypothetical protein HUG17_2194 [Dermatophagoides farinae]KAH9517208.1 hypothetical protein DERF_007891 [Dermatophagoides farinae]
MSNIDSINDKTFRNLISILISIVRTNLNEKNSNINHHLLSHMSLWLLSNDYCSIIGKYRNDEIETCFLHIRSIFLNNKNDLLLLYRFRQNLYPSLIGTNECFNGTKFDNIVSWLHRKYSDHLMLEKKMISLRMKNIQKINKIEQIYLDCFGNNRVRNNVWIILQEKVKQLEMLKKKSEKHKEIERLKRLLTIGISNNRDDDIVGSSTAINLHEQYRKITIENQLCQKQINILRQKKSHIESMDSAKIERIKQLIKDIRFVKELNATPPTVKISPIIPIPSSNNNSEDSPLNFSIQSSSTTTMDNISLSFDAELKF